MIDRFDLLYILKYESHKLQDAVSRLLCSIESIENQPVNIIVVNYSEEDLDLRIFGDKTLRYFHIPIRGFFSRAKTINFAVRNYVNTEYFAISDIDLVYQVNHFHFLRDLVNSSASTRKLRIVTYNYNVLSEDKSNYSADPEKLKKLPLSRGGYAHGNGIVHLQSFMQIRGYDEHFVGYGPEDDLFNCRISRINHLKFISDKRYATYHLWHEVNSFDKTLFENNMKYWLDQKIRLYGVFGDGFFQVASNTENWGTLL